MRDGCALDHAVDLARAPSLSRHLRGRSLPADTLMVIKVASGVGGSVSDAARATGLSPQFITEASRLYVRQVMLFPSADHHRILGLQPGADRGLMRVHMSHLLLWLHPDRQQSDWHARSAARVLEAWDALGRDRPPERAAWRGRAGRPRAGYEPAWIPRPVPRAAWLRTSRSLRHWLFWALIVAGLVLAEPAFSAEGGRHDPPSAGWAGAGP